MLPSPQYLFDSRPLPQHDHAWRRVESDTVEMAYRCDLCALVWPT